LTVSAAGRVYDLVDREELTGEPIGLTFGPGEGTLLLVGTPEEFEADCRLIDEQLRLWDGTPRP